MKQQLPPQLLQMINKLNVDQLHALNHIVIDRLKLLRKAQAVYAMRDFHMLDRVAFHHGQHYEGVITRFNQKTVTVTLDDGSYWNIAPDFLEKVVQENPLKEDVTIAKLSETKK